MSFADVSPAAGWVAGVCGAAGCLRAALQPRRGASRPCPQAMTPWLPSCMPPNIPCVEPSAGVGAVDPAGWHCGGGAAHLPRRPAGAVRRAAAGAHQNLPGHARAPGQQRHHPLQPPGQPVSERQRQKGRCLRKRRRQQGSSGQPGRVGAGPCAARPAGAVGGGRRHGGTATAASGSASGSSWGRQGMQWYLMVPHLTAKHGTPGLQLPRRWCWLCCPRPGGNRSDCPLALGPCQCFQQQVGKGGALLSGLPRHAQGILPCMCPLRRAEAGPPKPPHTPIRPNCLQTQFHALLRSLETRLQLQKTPAQTGGPAPAWQRPPLSFPHCSTSAVCFEASRRAAAVSWGASRRCKWAGLCWRPQPCTRLPLETTGWRQRCRWGQESCWAPSAAIAARRRLPPTAADLKTCPCAGAVRSPSVN